MLWTKDGIVGSDIHQTIEGNRKCHRWKTANKTKTNQKHIGSTKLQVCANQERKCHRLQGPAEGQWIIHQPESSTQPRQQEEQKRSPLQARHEHSWDYGIAWENMALGSQQKDLDRGGGGGGGDQARDKELQGKGSEGNLEIMSKIKPVSIVFDSAVLKSIHGLLHQ